MILTRDEYLAHYGVKGMKWGVRKDRVRSTVGRTVSTVRKKRAAQVARENAKRSPERKQVDSIRKTKKKAKYMTDAELKTAINRLNLETQYNRLSLEVYSPGKKFARDFVMRSGNKAADAVVQQYAIKKIRGS